MLKYSIKEISNNLSKILKLSLNKPIIITKNNNPLWVVICKEKYDYLESLNK